MVVETLFEQTLFTTLTKIILVMQISEAQQDETRILIKVSNFLEEVFIFRIELLDYFVGHVFERLDRYLSPLNIDRLWSPSYEITDTIFGNYELKYQPSLGPTYGSPYVRIRQSREGPFEEEGLFDRTHPDGENYIFFERVEFEHLYLELLELKDFLEKFSNNQAIVNFFRWRKASVIQLTTTA